MQQNDTIRNKNLGLKVTDKELTILYEIGLDLIPTATDLVESISMKYNISQSGIWYTLKKLKSEGLIDFAEKGEVHRPLLLTQTGTHVIRSRIIDVPDRQYHYVMDVAEPITAGA